MDCRYAAGFVDEALDALLDEYDGEAWNGGDASRPRRVRQDNSLSLLADLGLMDVHAAGMPATAVLLNQVCATIHVPRPARVEFDQVLLEYGADSEVPPMVADLNARFDDDVGPRMHDMLLSSATAGATKVFDALELYHPFWVQFSDAWEPAVDGHRPAACVEWLLDSLLDFDPVCASYHCARTGDLGFLARLRDRPREGWGAEGAFRGALRSADPDRVLAFLTAQGLAPPAEALQEAAMMGDAGLLRKLRDLGAPLAAPCLAEAVGSKSLAAVEFLCDEGCPDSEVPTETAACVAAYVGAVDVMACLHDSGYSVDHHAMNMAARLGDRAMVTLLLECGCPWGDLAFASACTTGDVDFVNWIVEAGCPVPEGVL